MPVGQEKALSNGATVIRMWLLPFAAVASVSSMAAAAGGTGAAPSITVLSCTVGADAHERPAMMVTFRNDGSDDLKQIVWHARFGPGWLTFPDQNDFPPGGQFTRTLSWKRGLTPGYYSSDRSDCTVAATSTPEYFFPTPHPNDATPVPPSIGNPSSDPIGIVSCKVSVNQGRPRKLGRKDGAALLDVRFRNLASKPIDRVVFRAHYLSGGVDFVDGGNFSPNTLIANRGTQRVLGQAVVGSLSRWDLPVTTPVDYFDFDDDPNNCVTVSAHFSDGTTWQNPDVGPSEPPMPTAPPTLPPS